jgi:hypothetical protein
MYTLSSSGKIVCGKCNEYAQLLEGGPTFIETTCANNCSIDPATCGFRDGRIDTNDFDPAFIELWTRLTGEAPKPFDIEDWF